MTDLSVSLIIKTAGDLQEFKEVSVSFTSPGLLSAHIRSLPDIVRRLQYYFLFPFPRNL
jgi:hypothetical protein